MAKRRCPGCGASYNGKFCPECYYTPFEAEEIPQLHSWELPESRPAPVRRSAFPSAQPKRGAKRTGTRKRPISKALKAAVMAVWSVIIVLFGLLGILFAVTSGITEDIADVFVEPEPITVPQNGMLVFDAADIQVLLDWDGGAITGDIPVYVVNDSDQDVIAYTVDVAVNGMMCEDVFFYVEARAGTVGMGQLWIDEEELSTLGIGKIGQIVFQLELQNDDTYDILNNRDMITLNCGDGDIPTAPEGTPIFDSDGIRVFYQGMHTDSDGEIILRFFAENNTGDFLSLDSSELTINGQACGRYLWKTFFPDADAVILVELYGISNLGIEEPADIHTVECSIQGAVGENWENMIFSDPIVLSIDSD